MSISAAKKTVMVVDDSIEMRELLCVQLNLLGYHAVEASNGREAVDMVSQDSPELILMDLSMPVLGGIEATRLIRTTNSAVVIVAFTGLSFAEGRQKALAAGCNDYVNKPLDVEELSKLLGRHL